MNIIAAVSWTQGVQDGWSKVATFVPKLFGFLLVLIIGYFLAKLISKVADKALAKAGFDKAVQRGGLGKVMAKSDMDASDLVSKLIFYALFLFVLEAAFGLFGANPVSALLTSVVAYLPKVFVAVVIVVLSAAIAAGAKEVITASLGGLSYGKTLANAVGVLILGLGGFSALNQLQIATAIVDGVFYAILAALVGVTVIAVGGSGIKPMQTRWENALQAYDSEKPKMQQEMQGSKERIQQRAGDLKAQAKSSNSGPGSGSAGGR